MARRLRAGKSTNPRWWNAESPLRCCGAMRMTEYDLVVIGSGPGGQKAAVAAAKLGKKVAVIERGGMLGGVCVNTGTIPSKSMREAVVYLTGTNQRELYGSSYRVKERITFSDLHAKTQHVIKWRSRRVARPAHAQRYRPLH